MNKIYNQVILEFGPDDFMKGLNYSSKKIKLLRIEKNGENKTAIFKVESERSLSKYEVEIEIDKDKNFKSYYCSCPQYMQKGKCKHITASILKYEFELLSDDQVQNNENYQIIMSKEIINKFYKPRKNKIKERLNLEITIKNESNYYDGDILEVSYKIGNDKLYTTSNKFNNFQNAYKENETFKFSKNFTYDPNIHYFDKEDDDILKYSENYLKDGRNYYGDIVNKDKLPSFMENLKNKSFYIEDNLYHGYTSENPLKINLTKENDNYILKIENIDNFSPLIEKSNFIYDENKVYKLSNDIKTFYQTLYENNLDSIIFKNKDIEKFTNGLLYLIKDSINISEDITEIIVPTKPKIKLYFDFHYNDIECKLKLKYSDKEIDYFSNVIGILRDEEYESKIIEKLSNLNFIIDETNQTILMDDIDSIGYFLEEGLFTFDEEYEIFTSEKIKDTNIIKKTNNSVSFSIGSDNILSYNFNLDGLNPKELSDILLSLKSKKKYHKLKNGSIINLNKDENLNQIKEITDDLGISNNDIKEGLGTIPKYRALYLNSLKNDFNVIKTNESFNNLINNFNSYKDSEINLPKENLKTLRDYQITGVKWLYNIYKSGFGGILADEMGLGKSIQLIYLIKLIIKENPKAKILIVAPTSLIYNWQKEFDKFGPELKYKVFAENKKQRQDNLKNIDDINIMITSYGLIRNDLDTYSKINFDLMAIDEAQNIKNASAGVTKSVKEIKSNIKIALTGTPIENNILEIWSIFDFIMPGFLANQDKFQNLYNVKDMDEESTKRLNKLNNQIKYFILRRKKKDVVKDLPDKIDNNIYIDLDKDQKKVYIAEVQKTKKALDDMIATEGFTKSKMKILQLLTKLRQICIDPHIIFENYQGESAKINELLKIVAETKANGHKMLIFTTYKKALDLVIPKLNNMKISSYYIDGSVPSKKRMELVEKFNNDDTDVFIITLKAGGTGLNLTSATVVIHLDLWWNPQVENQATDRAHRIGQKNKVEVIRLITKGTIEERILELQNKKRKLAEILIDGEDHNENQFSKLTEDDIKMLLSIDK